MSDLEQRISSALTDDNLDSHALSALYSETEAAISEADAVAERERSAAFDPALRPDVRTARQTLEDCVFMANRLRTMLPRLGRRHAEVALKEDQQSFEHNHATVKQARDELAAKFSEKYPTLIGELVDLFKEIERVDRLCSEVNSAASMLPNEPRRLRGVEREARDLQSFSRDMPSLLDASTGIRLLALDGTTAWPPPAPSFAASYASSIACVGRLDPRRASSDWWLPRKEDAVIQAERAREREAEQARQDAAARNSYFDSLRR